MFNAPNIVTLGRLLLGLWVVGSILYAPPVLQLANPLLLILIFAMDGIDGYLARRFKQESFFGALFDIAADRIIELLLLVALTKMDLVPLWVLVVFIIRFVLVDTIRSEQAKKGVAPFSMMTSSLGYFLVSGKAMRIFYAAVKGTTFGWLLLLQPLPALFPAFHYELLQPISSLLIYVTASLCVLRGLPVIWEFLNQKEKLS